MEKKKSSGGAVLLAKKGPEYFRKLAIKKGVMQREAMTLWRKMESESEGYLKKVIKQVNEKRSSKRSKITK